MNELFGLNEQVTEWLNYISGGARKSPRYVIYDYGSECCRSDYIRYVVS